MLPSKDPPQSQGVYLDTDVVVKTLIGGMDHSEACNEFCNNLVISGSTVYFSQILRLELSQALRNLPGRAQLPTTLRAEYNLDQWDASVLVRGRWMQYGVSQFDDLVSRFATAVELPFRRDIWEHSISLIARYRLQAHDAVHAATALAFQIPFFATSDAHFRRVTSLSVALIRD